MDCQCAQLALRCAFSLSARLATRTLCERAGKAPALCAPAAVTQVVSIAAETPVQVVFWVCGGKH